MVVRVRDRMCVLAAVELCITGKNVKVHTALHEKPIFELRGVTNLMESQCCLPPDTSEHAAP